MRSTGDKLSDFIHGVFYLVVMAGGFGFGIYISLPLLLDGHWFLALFLFGLIVSVASWAAKGGEAAGDRINQDLEPGQGRDQASARDPSPGRRHWSERPIDD